MGIEKGERKRVIVKGKEKEKVTRLINSILSEIMRKIERDKEKEKSEEKSLEMWEIREEIERMKKIEKANELSRMAKEKFRRSAPHEIEKMEISEKEFNHKKRETIWGEGEFREWRKSKCRRIVREENEKKRNKRQVKARLVETIVQ